MLYFVCCKGRLVFLQSSPGVFEGLVCESFLFLRTDAGQQSQITGRSGQTPQKLCLVTANKSKLRDPPTLDHQKYVH